MLAQLEDEANHVQVQVRELRDAPIIMEWEDVGTELFVFAREPRLDH